MGDPASAPEATAVLVEALWETKQVADLLRFHEKTIARLGRLNQIPGAVKIGARAIRFRPDVIRAWIAAGCPPQAAPRMKKTGTHAGA